jgi:hypothetical protein
VIGKRRVEAVYDANQTLCERRIAELSIFPIFAAPLRCIPILFNGPARDRRTDVRHSAPPGRGYK